ncbi:MAG: TRAP transporter small permease subunit, partial [Rhodobacteraceae bacterium]|nr:TRAP transporter small permease subunit [Paracoccaceae bacterium]
VELVEMGAAIAIFSFLPLCHMTRGHVTVDILVERLPTRLRLLLTVIGEIAIALVAWLMLWRLWIGFGERLPFLDNALRAQLGFGMKPFFPETTFILGIPVWMGFGVALIGAGLFFVVSLYAIWRALNWLMLGEEEVL